MRDRLSVWVDEAIRSIERGGLYDSIPLDRLLGAEFRRSEAVQRGQEEHARLVVATRRSDVRVVPRLMVPLADSPDLEANPPALEVLQSHLGEIEPPKLYLCHPDVFLPSDPFEEYRLPLSRRADPAGGALVVYYSCFRDESARLNGWEYARCVWFDHYW